MLSEPVDVDSWLLSLNDEYSGRVNAESTRLRSPILYWEKVEITELHIPIFCCRKSPFFWFSNGHLFNGVITGVAAHWFLRKIVYFPCEKLPRGALFPTTAYRYSAVENHRFSNSNFPIVVKEKTVGFGIVWCTPGVYNPPFACGSP